MSHQIPGLRATVASAADITDQPTMLASQEFPHLAGQIPALLKPRTHSHQVMTSPGKGRELGSHEADPGHERQWRERRWIRNVSLLLRRGLAGPFSDDPRITDPRGLSLSPAGDLAYITSGDNRVLALDKNGNVILDSGRNEGVDAGGGTFAPDGRYCVTLRRGTILAFPPRLDTEGVPLLPDGAVPFPQGFGFGDGGQLYLSSGGRGHGDRLPSSPDTLRV